MGSTESKNLSKDLKLFPPEERILLEQNFENFPGSTNKKAERKGVEVSNGD